MNGIFAGEAELSGYARGRHRLGRYRRSTSRPEPSRSAARSSGDFSSACFRLALLPALPAPASDAGPRRWPSPTSRSAAGAALSQLLRQRPRPTPAREASSSTRPANDGPRRQRLIEASPRLLEHGLAHLARRPTRARRVPPIDVLGGEPLQIVDQRRRRHRPCAALTRRRAATPVRTPSSRHEALLVAWRRPAGRPRIEPRIRRARPRRASASRARARGAARRPACRPC